MTKPVDLSFTVEDLDKAMSNVKSSAGELKTPPCPDSQKTFYKYISGIERKRLIENDDMLHKYENNFTINGARVSELLDISDSSDE